MPGKKKATKKTEPTTTTEAKPTKPRQPKTHLDIVQVWAVVPDEGGGDPVDILEDKEGAKLCAKSFTDKSGTKTVVEERDALVVTTTIPGGRGKSPEVKREFYVLDPDFEQPMIPGASDFSRLSAARASAISKLSKLERIALGLEVGDADEEPEEEESKPEPSAKPSGTAENPASATEDEDDGDVFDDEDEENEDDEDDPFAEAGD